MDGYAKNLGTWSKRSQLRGAHVEDRELRMEDRESPSSIDSSDSSATNIRWAFFSRLPRKWNRVDWASPRNTR